MLFVAASLLLAVGPGATQDVPSPEARRAEIVRLVLRHGESRFEAAEAAPDALPEAYLMLNSAGQPSYAEGSLEYAAALLMSGADTARAAKIIGTVLAAQAAGGKCPGGFPWRPETEADPYATAFLAPWLAYIHQHLTGGLPDDLRARLSASLKPALGAVQRFSVGVDAPQAS